MSKKTKIITAVVMAAVLVVGGVFVYGRVTEKETAETTENVTAAVTVSAKVPQVGELAVTGTYIGTVSPEEQVSVIPMVSGEVTEVNFAVGDYVEAGSVLVRVDDEAARIQLQSAQLSKEAAELNAERTLGSTQYSTNLSMVSSIQSIESQIAMAKKQYDAAGDSVEDAKQAKEDLQDALDQINSSISSMESNYSSMKSMAVSAKQLVEQDESGVWRWKVNLLKDELEELQTDNTGSFVPQTGNQSNIIIEDESGNDPDSVISSQAANENTDGTSGTNGGSTSSDTDGGQTTSSSSTDGSQATGETTTEPSDAATNGSSDTGTTSSDTTPSSQASDETPTPTGDDTTGADDSTGTDDTASATPSIYAVSTGAAEDTVLLSVREMRSHQDPRRADEAKNMTMTYGEQDYSVIAVSDNSAQIAALQAQIAALEPATQKMIASGYSPADIGEGRVDESVASFATQIASLKSQAATLESNIKSMDSTIEQAEMSQETTGDTIGVYQDNLKVAQTQYAHQNGQAYADTAAALQNQIDSTEIGIASAQMQLDNYVLTAPISGYIEQKNVDEYGFVSAGNPVYVISNKDSMTVTFYVSEAVKNQLAVGQSVTLERSGQTAAAVITQLGQSVDSRTGLFEIKASTSEGNLANGVTVQIHVDTKKVTDAILIPYDAVYFEGENAYVYCVEGDTLVKTQVVTGLFNEDTIEITDGLTKDSVVVNTWSPQLSSGVKVRLVEE